MLSTADGGRKLGRSDAPDAVTPLLYVWFADATAA
jgi:hypothetical protein